MEEINIILIIIKYKRLEKMNKMNYIINGLATVRVKNRTVINELNHQIINNLDMKNKRLNTRKLRYVFYILLACVYSVAAQDFGNLNYNHDCGSWEKDSTYITEWQTKDTLNYNKCGDTIWIYDEWKRELSPAVLAVYCPCGCRWDDKEYQDRVCGLGIIQRRWKITTYKYIPKPESNYDRRVRELNAH